MLAYAYYNADLIDIAKGKNELFAGFIDDCAFVAVADMLDETHCILKNMMERPNGGLDWSTSHNSPFKLFKLAIMNFSRTSHNTTFSPLSTWFMHLVHALSHAVITIITVFCLSWKIYNGDIMGDLGCCCATIHLQFHVLLIVIFNMDHMLWPG